jgi:hypothetical protein
MITLLESEDHTVRRCIELIERHAPRLMRAGGGALEQEYSTAELRSAVVKRRAAGVSTAVVAEEFGVSTSAVKQWCWAAGVELRAA